MCSLRGGQTSLDELVLHRPVPYPFLDGIDNERGERLAGAQQTLGLAAKSRLDAKGWQSRGFHVLECIADAMQAAIAADPGVVSSSAVLASGMAAPRSTRLVGSPQPHCDRRTVTAAVAPRAARRSGAIQTGRHHRATSGTLKCPSLQQLATRTRPKLRNPIEIRSARKGIGGSNPSLSAKSSGCRLRNGRRLVAVLGFGILELAILDLGRLELDRDWGGCGGRAPGGLHLALELLHVEVGEERHERQPLSLDARVAGSEQIGDFPRRADRVRDEDPHAPALRQPDVPADQRQVTED